MYPPWSYNRSSRNAIWHGMAKEEKGHITLSVQRRGSELVMAIEDDGVGRHAQRSRAKRQLKKTSLATVAKARLDLVQKQKGKPAGFKYIDLPQGTRVELSLPIDGAG